MKRLYFFASILLLSMVAIAQEEAEKKEPVVKFSGHIRYEGYFDTYESATSRDGNIYLYPLPASENADGDDVRAYSQFNMLSAQSRLRAKVNGPDAFGAKVNGTAEIDFLGKGSGWEQTPRIRHMFMNLSWDKANLTLGQTWHPVFVTECFPQVLSMGAALPFNPLNRAPQVKFGYKLSDNLQFVAAALSHYDMASTGPSAAQKQAVVPDLHFQFKYASSSLNAGLVGGFKTLKPRITTDAGSMTDKKASSYDIAAFAKIKASDVTFKVYGIYGENLTPYVMIGGYGASDNPTTVDDYDYSNIQTMSLWSEVMYNAGAVGYGLFFGYQSNLGSSETNYYDLGYTRGGNIDNIMRLSPRISFTSGKVMFGVEYMMTSATYGALDTNNNKYEFTDTDDAVSNNRIHISAKYTF